MIDDESRAKMTQALKIRDAYRFYTKIPKSEGGVGGGLFRETTPWGNGIK